MTPEDQTTGTDETKTDAGNICINRNSAGGTCDHYNTEHIDNMNQCVECDCPYFIPNP